MSRKAATAKNFYTNQRNEFMVLNFFDEFFDIVKAIEPSAGITATTNKHKEPVFVVKYRSNKHTEVEFEVVLDSDTCENCYQFSDHRLGTKTNTLLALKKNFENQFLSYTKQNNVTTAA